MASTIQIQEAQPSHLPSLETIFPRAFFPTGTFHEKIFPDTPANRVWWNRVYSDEINDSSCHALVAANPANNHVHGILTLRLMGPDEPGCGFFSMYNFTPETNISLLKIVIDAVHDYRMKLYKGTGKKHFLLELFGVDFELQKTGLGRKLMERACEVADQEGVEMFVEADGPAKGFYEKFGFREVGVEGGGRVEVDDEGSVEWILVRGVGGVV